MILVVLQDVVTFVMDLFDPDILQFAGLALILFGILKKFIKNDYVILAIAITLSVISTLLPFYNFEGWILDDIVGLFVCSVDPEYFVGGPFPLISWFIFIPSGYIFAKEIKNNNATYKKALFASLIIICNYLLIAIPNKIGMMNSSKYFYKLGILDSLVCIAGAILALSIYYLISKNINEKLRLIITNISSRITYIYFIQWVLIVLMYTLSLKLNINIVSDIQMFLLGVLNIILSISLSFVICK